MNTILKQRDYAIISERKLHFINTPIRSLLQVNLLEQFKPFISFNVLLVANRSEEHVSYVVRKMYMDKVYQDVKGKSYENLSMIEAEEAVSQ